MFPAGGALVKLLATMTALLTVITGGAHVECVRPDGRVKYFCHGPTARECCCSSVSVASEGEQNHRPAECARHTCCARAKPMPSTQPASDGPAPAVKPCGCQRTLVADTLAYTAEDGSDGSRFEAGAVVAWAGHSAVTKHPTRSDRTERRFLLPPPDRVILFCHFTC